MYIMYKFPFLNGITEIYQLFHDILIIWPPPVHIVWRHPVGNGGVAVILLGRYMTGVKQQMQINNEFISIQMFVFNLNEKNKKQI